VKGNVSRPDRWPAVLLAGGFLVSATAVFALASAFGAALLGSWRTQPATWLAAAGLLGLLLLADAELFGLRTPMWRRQTPKWFMYRFGDRRSALFWGLDAGLVGTTFRVTSLSWAALVLTLLGPLPWWAGIVYALGFVLPELIFDLAVPRRRVPDGTPDPEPTWVLAGLLRVRPFMRGVGVTLLGSAGLWLVVMALAGFH
jgi:hypothetical protein